HKHLDILHLHRLESFDPSHDLRLRPLPGRQKFHHLAHIPLQTTDNLTKLPWPAPCGRVTVAIDHEPPRTSQLTLPFFISLLKPPCRRLIQIIDRRADTWKQSREWTVVFMGFMC
ncbi:MAG: hypothetical protein ACLP1D_07595, partial [Xanthobacteraceae bacterium]